MSRALATVLADLAPMLQRLQRLEPAGVVRLRLDRDRLTALAAVPVGVLAGRTLALPHPDTAASVTVERDLAAPDRVTTDRTWSTAWNPTDVTVGTADLLAGIEARDPDDDGPVELPSRRDTDWHHTPPPTSGWRRVAELDDDQVRAAVRAAATAVKAAPLPAAADLALDAPAFPNAVLPAVAALDRRGPSALVKLGFLPRGATTAVDVAGSWTRLAAPFGSVFVRTGERGATGPNLLAMLG